MKLYIPLSTLLLLFLCFSCGSDDEGMPVCDPDPKSPCESALQFLPLNDTCFALPPTPTFGWLFESVEFRYGGPLINQSNGNEFIYALIATNDSIISGNYKIDICTNEKNKIELSPGGGNWQAKWSGDDWIVYLGPSQQVYKIKSDGSMSTQITFKNEPFEFITWVDEHTILTNTEFPDLSPPHRSVLINVETHEIVDTLAQSYPHPSFFNGKIASDLGFLGEKEIGYLELDDMEFVSLFSLIPHSEFGIVRQIEWLDEEHIIWIDKKGIHTIDIISQEETLLIEFCENADIYSMSVFPEKDGRLLLSRTERWPINEQVLLYENQIIYFDTNTGEQWEIDLSP